MLDSTVCTVFPLKMLSINVFDNKFIWKKSKKSKQKLVKIEWQSLKDIRIEKKIEKKNFVMKIN